MKDSIQRTKLCEDVAEHGAIAKAICTGDDALAKQLMRSHLKKDYAQYLERSEILES